MKGQRMLLVAMLTSCVLFLGACRNRAEFSGGKTLSDVQMQEMLVSLQEGTDVAQEQGARYYFVQGSGAVYHSDAACGHLKNSKNVQVGSLAEVLAAGKERLCEACAQKEVDIQLPSDAQGEDTRGCYYTPGGTVWHFDAACPSLSHSENVREGTVAEAKLDGKSRACSRCGN